METVKDQVQTTDSPSAPLSKPSCPPVLPSPCLLASPAGLSLAEAFRRFEREAERGVCDTGRYRCAYFSWGTGPPLLCIPGLGDNGRAFVLLSALLAEHFRCIAYNLPSGRGDGARMSRYTHAALVEDAFALLDHLGLRQSYFLGYSFGTTVTLAALRARPERVPRAVLQAGFARRPLATAEVLLARLARYWPGPMRLLPFHTALMRRCHYEPFATRPPEVWEFFLDQCGSPPMAAVARYALMVHRLDLRPLLPAIRQPVLMVCGDCDPLVTRECEEELLHGLPNVARVEISNCGHYPLFTHPGVLAEVVRRFLTPPAKTSPV
jgi:pimeloyl-ACP methyl ester carboxylesterase